MNPNPAWNKAQRYLLRLTGHLLTLFVAVALTGCSPGQNLPKTAIPAAMSTVTATVAPPLPGVEAPSAIIEQPLQGSPINVPNVWIVPSMQSKQELASYIKTDVVQLDWVNPGLPNPVPPGTLVVIPPGYFARADTPLADIVASTGLPSEALLSANPNLSMDEIVSAGTVLVVPQLYFITEETEWDAAAAILNVSGEALLSANPDLAEDDDDLDAGVVLIIPPEEGAE